MPSQQAKLNRILDAIHSEAEKQRLAIVKETEERCGVKLKEAEDNALYECFILLQRRAAAIREETGKTISEKINSSKKTLVNRRFQLTDGVFDLARQKLLNYKNTDAYREFVQSSITKAKALLGDISAVYICGEDAQLSDMIQAASGCAPIIDKDIKIGGLRFVGNGLAADDTLDSKLEAQRQWFAEHCGIKL